jgi:hypothetical protein
MTIKCGNKTYHFKKIFDINIEVRDDFGDRVTIEGILDGGILVEVNLLIGHGIIKNLVLECGKDNDIIGWELT